MGISDEAYGDALVYEKQKQYQQKQAKENSSMNTTGSNNTALGYQALSLTTTGHHNTAVGSWSNTSATPSGSKVLNEQDLQHDAMKAPLSALLDMWTVRWSGEWVSETEFQEDTFWRLALIRLVGANKLEKHHLANQYAAVYRIIQ